MPGLQELLGQASQGLGITGGVDGPGHALEFELLAEAEGDGVGHDGF